MPDRRGQYDHYRAAGAQAHRDGKADTDYPAEIAVDAYLKTAFLIGWMDEDFNVRFGTNDGPNETG